MEALCQSSRYLEIGIFDAVMGSGVEFAGEYVLHGRNSIRYDRKRCQSQHGRLLTPGEIGCAFSHFIVYKEFAESEQPMMLIMEDDACLIQDDSIIRQTLSAIPPYDAWDLCYVQRGDYDVLLPVNPRYLRIRSGAPRTHGYIITQRGAQRLLEGFSLHSAADGYLARTLGDHDVVLCSIPPLVGLGGNSNESEIDRIGNLPLPDESGHYTNATRY